MLAALEDAEISRLVARQEAVGLDVVTDGELRRPAWADTVRHLEGIGMRHTRASYPNGVRVRRQPFETAEGIPTVIGRVQPRPDSTFGEEFAFLRARTAKPTKYTMPAPSYHRRFWSDEVSPEESPYASCEEYLSDVRDWLHGVATRLAAQGCSSIQLDAPNYGSLCDAACRQFHEAEGHDLEREVEFDACLDSSVFDGLSVTSALHVCRGNMPGGIWHSEGGYAAISDLLFPNLGVDVVLLEYDSARAGDFDPLAAVPDGTVSVLGLITTKSADLEQAEDLYRRIEEASRVRDLEQLALSTQCGFGSAANAPMSEDAQWRKLELVASVAHSTWKP